MQTNITITLIALSLAVFMQLFAVAMAIRFRRKGGISWPITIWCIAWEAIATILVALMFTVAAGNIITESNLQEETKMALLMAGLPITSALTWVYFLRRIGKDPHAQSNVLK